MSRHDDDDDYDDDDRPRSKSRRRNIDNKYDLPRLNKRRKKSSGGLGAGAIAGIVLGGLILLGGVAIGIVFLAKKGGGGDSSANSGDLGSSKPIDASKVTRESFRSLKAGMTLDQVEGILGGSRSSSVDELRDALRRERLTELEVSMGPNQGLLRDLKSWRRWESNEVRVWVAFVQTNDGQRAAFSSSIYPFIGNASMFEHGFYMSSGGELEKVSQDRKEEDSIRNDARWVRGAQAREFLLGEWRDSRGFGYLFASGGRLNEYGFIDETNGRGPTYRVDDRMLDITHPSVVPNQPPTTDRYEYYVNQDELALINISRGPTVAARLLYRSPIRAGSVGETKLLGPLLADLKGADDNTRQQAYTILYKIGKNGAVALPQLVEIVRGPNLKAACLAASVIGIMRESAVSVVPELIKQLRNSDIERAIACARALGTIGPAAKDALPALREVANKSMNAEFRIVAQDAIRGIGGRPF